MPRPFREPDQDTVEQIIELLRYCKSVARKLNEISEEISEQDYIIIGHQLTQIAIKTTMALEISASIIVNRPADVGRPPRWYISIEEIHFCLKDFQDHIIVLKLDQEYTRWQKLDALIRRVAIADIEPIFVAAKLIIVGGQSILKSNPHPTIYRPELIPIGDIWYGHSNSFKK